MHEQRLWLHQNPWHMYAGIDVGGMLWHGMPCIVGFMLCRCLLMQSTDRIRRLTHHDGVTRVVL